MAQTNKSKAGQANRSTVNKAVDAAKDNPKTAAAIGAGVVAAVAGAAFGAVKYAQSRNASETGDDLAMSAAAEEDLIIDPMAVPSGISVP